MADSKISDLVAKSTLADTDQFVIASGAANNKVLRSVLATELFRDGSNDLLIENTTLNRDIKFQGDDGGVSITPLRFDISENVAVFGTSTKLSTGDEGLPDCDVGGVTTLITATTGKFFTCKEASINHGLTSIAETDTGALLKLRDIAAGGVGIDAITDGSETTPLVIFQRAFSRDTADTTVTTSSWGLQTLMSAQHDGANTISNVADAGNIFAWRNNNTTRMILKGNGTMHITNTTLVALDDHNDIELLDTSRKLMEGKREGLNQDHINVLKNAGVFNSDLSMINTQQMQKFTQDTMIQMVNIIKGLAKKINISDSELFQMAKEY